MEKTKYTSRAAAKELRVGVNRIYQHTDRFQGPGAGGRFGIPADDPLGRMSIQASERRVIG